MHAISVWRFKTSLTCSENSFFSPFSHLLYSSHHSRNVGEIPGAAWLDLSVQHWKEGRASDVFHLFFSFFFFVVFFLTQSLVQPSSSKRNDVTALLSSGPSQRKPPLSDTRPSSLGSVAGGVVCELSSSVRSSGLKLADRLLCSFTFQHLQRILASSNTVPALAGECCGSKVGGVEVAWKPQLGPASPG